MFEDFLQTMRKTLWFFSTRRKNKDSFKVHSKLPTKITNVLAYVSQCTDVGLSP